VPARHKGNPKRFQRTSQCLLAMNLI